MTFSEREPRPALEAAKDEYRDAFKRIVFHTLPIAPEIDINTLLERLDDLDLAPSAEIVYDEENLPEIPEKLQSLIRTLYKVNPSDTSVRYINLGENTCAIGLEMPKQEEEINNAKFFFTGTQTNPEIYFDINQATCTTFHEPSFIPLQPPPRMSEQFRTNGISKESPLTPDHIYGIALMVQNAPLVNASISLTIAQAD